MRVLANDFWEVWEVFFLVSSLNVFNALSLAATCFRSTLSDEVFTSFVVAFVVDVLLPLLLLLLPARFKEAIATAVPVTPTTTIAAETRLVLFKEEEEEEMDATFGWTMMMDFFPPFVPLSGAK